MAILADVTSLRPIFLIVLWTVGLLPSTHVVGQGWDSSAIRGRGGDKAPFRVQPFLPDAVLTRPVEAFPIPEKDNSLIVAELNGNIWALSLNDSGTSLQSRQRLREAIADERLYSIAFYPAGGEPTDLLAVIHRRNPDGSRHNQLVRFPWHGADEELTEETLILQWPTAGHDGSDIEIGRDGMVYVTSGDGQAPGDPANSGQRTDDLLGSVLRIDIREAPYRIPADNPFVGVTGVRPEVWAYGLRNPFRMGQDIEGRLWIGDNGEDLWEMLHLGQPGANYGWSAFEGGRPFRPLNLGGPVSEITLPIVTRPHSEARSLVGGPDYQGNQFPELREKILYGDYTTGMIWAFSWDAQARTAGPSEWLTQAPSFLGFGATGEKEPIILGNDGGLYRLERRDPNAVSQTFPDRLSATGLFRSIPSHSLASGVHAYTIATPRWADGAEAWRFIALPEGGRLQPFRNRAWTLPDDSVAGLTYHVDGKPVETQLIHFEERTWRFYTYAWTPDGSDAELVPAEGKTGVAPDGAAWRFPSQAECRMCHTAQSGFLLGFTPWQVPEATIEDNPTLSNAIRRRVDHDFAPFPTWSGDVPSDPAAVEPLARAYLHTNCAHCHREGALGGRADFQLLGFLENHELGALHARPQLDITPHPENRIIAPGAPHRSALIQRMQSTDGGRMPLLGSTKPDQKGLELLEAWIANLADE